MFDQSEKTKPRTYPSGEVGIQLIGEEWLRQLAEIQLERSSDGIDVHLPHHERHVPVVCTAHHPHQSLNCFLTDRLITGQSELTGIEGSLQRLDVGGHARHSVDPHLVHPPPLDLFHALSHDEGDLRALPPGGEDTDTTFTLKSFHIEMPDMLADSVSMRREINKVSFSNRRLTW